MKPSSLYRANLWQVGMTAARKLPFGLASGIVHLLARIYWVFAGQRRQVVVLNLLPGTSGDRAAAKNAAKRLFLNFSQKLLDLWRYESGQPIDDLFCDWRGWNHLQNAGKNNRGVLLLTPHLGNWEFGAPLLARRGMKLLVITQEEPDAKLTAMRKASRERWGIETIVIGTDMFAFVEVVRRLEAGAVIALLVDRPPPRSAVEVNLFGQPFLASVAAAELARATGCALVPVFLPRMPEGYAAHALPAIDYNRAALRDSEERRKLTQRIIDACAPMIRQHLDQWYHFVPVWSNASKGKNS